MKTSLLLFCAVFTFGLATAQETKTTKTKVKVETTAKPAQTVKANAIDTPGGVSPVDTPDNGANSRDNSRQSNYNDQPATDKTTTTSTKTTKIVDQDLKNDNTGVINPTDAPAEGANSRDNSRQSKYNSEPKK